MKPPYSEKLFSFSGQGKEKGEWLRAQATPRVQSTSELTGKIFKCTSKVNDIALNQEDF